MGPIAGLWVRTMRERGHDVSVVTAYPHYPRPLWGQRLRPRREVRDGVPVLRLPLWVGHGSARARIREEATYALSATAAMALLPAPDVYVVVSPSFAALAPVSAMAPLRRTPWVLWLQDILPEAAVTTGLVRDSSLVELLAARFERIAYRSADRIVVISETFRRNLLDKGVAGSKVDVVYNPAVRGRSGPRAASSDEATILAMGNIGLSQGLTEHVQAFEASALDARLVILGTGEAADSVRAAIRSSRVEMCGLVDAEWLERELDVATVGLVTQRVDVTEFNVPSRLMTFMGMGIPVIASVRASSEVARIVERSGGGWVTSLPSFIGTLEAALADPSELARRGDAARRFASDLFDPAVMCATFEQLLREVVDASPRPSRARPAR